MANKTDVQIGKVVQIIGPVVDVEFQDYLPPIYQALRISSDGFDVETPGKELHAVWDDLFDEPTGGHGEGRDDSDANAEQIAHALEAKIRNGKLSVPDDGAKDLEPAHWAKESYEHREFVYSPEQDPANPKNHIVTDAYMDKAREIGEGRVTLAGARLAKILDDIFGH